MIVFLLTRAGCETEVATTGKKAMQMAEAGQFRFDYAGRGFAGRQRIQTLQPLEGASPFVRYAGGLCVRAVSD